MKIECKLFSFDGKKEFQNDFEFELLHNTAIASTDNADRSIVMIGGNPLTINVPFAELRKLKKSIRNAERDNS